MTLNKKTIFVIFSIIFLLNVSVFPKQLKVSGKKHEIEKKSHHDKIDNWKKDILKIRKKKNEEFKFDKTSPMAGKIRLVALNDGKYYLNSDKDSLIFLKKKGKNVLFSVLFKDNKWIYDDADNKVHCLFNKTEVKLGEKIPFRAMIKTEKYTIMVYPLDKYLVATVYDSNREIIKKFKGLKYYKPDYNYNVDAVIQRIKNPEKVVMLTSKNLKKTFYKYAKISFKIHNKKYFLYAFKSVKLYAGEDDILFIPFTDKTTGVESYSSGRYLEITEPKNDKFKLDFNLAFNPLCNYSPAYNCAIPPSDNNLDIKIKAGEKTYPVKH